jgi:hypothetical protein
MFSYTVTATFEDPAIAEQWIQWLRHGHLREVCEAGALDAEVIRFDPLAQEDAGPSRALARCAVRYHFASREAFAAYERDHAPRLRAEGLKRFPPEHGFKYERSTGEVVAINNVSESSVSFRTG